MLTVQLDADKLYARFDSLGHSAGDVTPALKRFGAYMLKTARADYAAQDFAPLAESTLEKRAAKGLQRLEGKLRTDYRKAKLRAHTQRRKEGLERSRSVLGQLLDAATGADLVNERAVMQTRGVRNRLAVLEEYERRHRGGAGGGKLTDAQTKSLNAREERAVSKAVGAPILGRLAKSLTFVVEDGTMTLASHSSRHWTEIHNKGGTAGHGAKIPARTTLKVDNTDLMVLRAILVDEMLIAFSPME